MPGNRITQLTEDTIEVISDSGDPRIDPLLERLAADGPEAAANAADDAAYCVNVLNVVVCTSVSLGCAAGAAACPVTGPGVAACLAAVYLTCVVPAGVACGLVLSSAFGAGSGC